MLTTANFTFNPETKSLVAEASCISALGSHYLVGNTIQVQSLFTGKIVTFQMTDQETDREGDLLSVTYTPRETLSKVERVVILND